MLRLSSAIALLLTLLISNAQAQRDFDRDQERDRPQFDRGRDRDRGDRDRNRDWVLLGQQTVGFRVDRDVINIDQSEDWHRNRSFRSLRFVAERNDVYMMSIRLVYLNGYSEVLRIDRVIPQAGQLPIDLGGERSYLKQIEMSYRSRPDYRGQAVITVFGEPARRVGGTSGPPPVPPIASDWAELGCQQVSLFGNDRDSIRVGRQEGRFKAIRLLARDADVEVLDLKVIYAEGQPDDIAVQHFIRAGERTRPLDLKGWERAIDRVDIVYRTAINPVEMIARQRINTPAVCVEGLQ
jgi:hypothetical protein